MESLSLPGFRHTFPLQVRWSDMDSLGHVNNARFLTYIEDARIDYTQTLHLRDLHPDRPGLIIAKIVIDFRHPLFVGEEVVVFSRCARLGSRSFDMEQTVTRRKDDDLQIIAQATATVVVYDYATSKSMPIPEHWRTVIKDYEVSAPNE
jgi:acyl-CoA thioester hydrolase